MLAPIIGILIGSLKYMVSHPIKRAPRVRHTHFIKRGKELDRAAKAAATSEKANPNDTVKY